MSCETLPWPTNSYLRQVFEDYSELMMMLKESLKVWLKIKDPSRRSLIYFSNIFDLKSDKTINAWFVPNNLIKIVIVFAYDSNYKMINIKLRHHYRVVHLIHHPPLYEEDYETFEKLFLIIKESLKIK